MIVFHLSMMLQHYTHFLTTFRWLNFFFSLDIYCFDAFVTLWGRTVVCVMLLSLSVLMFFIRIKCGKCAFVCHTEKILSSACVYVCVLFFLTYGYGIQLWHWWEYIWKLASVGWIRFLNIFFFSFWIKNSFLEEPPRRLFAHRHNEF